MGTNSNTWCLQRVDDVVQQNTYCVSCDHYFEYEKSARWNESYEIENTQTTYMQSAVAQWHSVRLKSDRSGVRTPRPPCSVLKQESLSSPKYWLTNQETVAPYQHDWKCVDRDVKQLKQQKKKKKKRKYLFPRLQTWPESHGHQSFGCMSSLQSLVASIWIPLVFSCCLPWKSMTKRF